MRGYSPGCSTRVSYSIHYRLNLFVRVWVFSSERNSYCYRLVLGTSFSRLLSPSSTKAIRGASGRTDEYDSMRDNAYFALSLTWITPGRTGEKLAQSCHIFSITTIQNWALNPSQNRKLKSHVTVSCLLCPWAVQVLVNIQIIHNHKMFVYTHATLVFLITTLLTP